MNIRFGFDGRDGDDVTINYFVLTIFTFPVLSFSALAEYLNDEWRYKKMFTLFGFYILWWK